MLHFFLSVGFFVFISSFVAFVFYLLPQLLSVHQIDAIVNKYV